jgi:hypothetical protein
MKCPYCGDEMVPGTPSVKGTLLGFFAIGLSCQHLPFGQLDGGEMKRSFTVGAQKPDIGVRNGGR